MSISRRLFNALRSRRRAIQSASKPTPTQALDEVKSILIGILLTSKDAAISELAEDGLAAIAEVNRP